jgi:hypothetical protein
MIIEYPFSIAPVLTCGEPHVVCRLSRDEEHWRRGFDNHLMDDWRSPALFTNLEVRRSGIALRWPFTSPPVVSARAIPKPRPSLLHQTFGEKNTPEAPSSELNPEWEEVVAELLRAGKQPGGTVTWDQFCAEVRDKCGGWTDRRKGRARRGFGGKTIRRIVAKQRTLQIA